MPRQRRGGCGLGFASMDRSCAVGFRGNGGHALDLEFHFDSMIPPDNFRGLTVCMN